MERLQCFTLTDLLLKKHINILAQYSCSPGLKSASYITPQIYWKSLQSSQALTVMNVDMEILRIFQQERDKSTREEMTSNHQVAI